MEEQIFIDPVLHSQRLASMRTGLGVAAAGMAFGLIVGIGRANDYSLQSLLMAASAVAAAMGLSYYMQQKTRKRLPPEKIQLGEMFTP